MGRATRIVKASSSLQSWEFQGISKMRGCECMPQQTAPPMVRLYMEQVLPGQRQELTGIIVQPARVARWTIKEALAPIPGLNTTLPPWYREMAPSALSLWLTAQMGSLFLPVRAASHHN